MIETASVDDSDYIEFSTAEAMVAAGGDPRLQALRKRLQAKKELLKQLNRMYTSFLGGNAAASECKLVHQGVNNDRLLEHIIATNIVEIMIDRLCQLL